MEGLLKEVQHMAIETLMRGGLNKTSRAVGNTKHTY
jgi:hypothetical protein